MQTKVFLCALLSAASLAAGADTTTTSSSSSKSADAKSTSKAISDLNSYRSSLYSGSQYKSFSSKIGSIATDTAIFPAPTVTDSINVPTITTAADITKASSDVQSFFSSVYKAEQSIVSKDLSGAAPQPTGMVMAAGAAAAGVLGLAALI